MIQNEITEKKLLYHFSLPFEWIIRSLEQVIEWRGKPKAIRCNNGPEYISQKILDWTEKQKISLDHIQPGNLNKMLTWNRDITAGTVRYDWLSQYLFDSIEEVQEHATRCLWAGNVNAICGMINYFQ